MVEINGSCEGYATVQEAIHSVAEDRFAWPGGYAMGILTTDGDCICSACVADNLYTIIDDACNDTGGEAFPDYAPYYCDADDDGYEGDTILPVLCDSCNRPISDATTIK